MISSWFLQEDARLTKLLLQSRADLEQKLDSYGDYYSSSVIYDLALVAALEGNKAEVERVVRAWYRDAARDVANKFYTRHRICRILGMAKAAVAAADCIREGITEPSLVMPFMEAYLPHYDSIRDEPEFAALLDEL